MHKHTSLFFKYVFSKLKKILSLIYKTFNWLWEKSRQRKKERERERERERNREELYSPTTGWIQTASPSIFAPMKNQSGSLNSERMSERRRIRPHGVCGIHPSCFSASR